MEEDLFSTDFFTTEDLELLGEEAVESSDAEVGFLREGLLPRKTEQTYNSFRKKFANFLGIEFDDKKSIAAQHYTDDNIASFLASLRSLPDFSVGYCFSFYDGVYFIFCIFR